MKRVYIALGSNLGVPAEFIDTALQQISELPDTTLINTSPWYKTAPIGGPEDQPDYTNAACLISTLIAPIELLKELQAIELQSGRTRDIRWGPRTLDLDIIWYEGFTSAREELTVPHPRAHERAFVLQPLLDLEATFELNGGALSDHLSALSEQRITRLEPNC